VHESDLRNICPALFTTTFHLIRFINSFGFRSIYSKHPQDVVEVAASDVCPAPKKTKWPGRYPVDEPAGVAVKELVVHQEPNCCEDKDHAVWQGKHDVFFMYHWVCFLDPTYAHKAGYLLNAASSMFLSFFHSDIHIIHTGNVIQNVTNTLVFTDGFSSLCVCSLLARKCWTSRKTTH